MPIFDLLMQSDKQREQQERQHIIKKNTNQNVACGKDQDKFKKRNLEMLVDIYFKNCFGVA